MNIDQDIKQLANEFANCQKELARCLEKCNKESGLSMQIFYDEPKCFSGLMASYGKFSDVTNYIAIVGEKSKSLEETAGYFGEEMVLKAQELGLNTCWVAATYGKGKCQAKVNKGEKLICVISLGYGKTQGVSRKSKAVSQVSNYSENSLEWFKEGVEAALLAPTEMNQQKFYFEITKDQVSVKSGSGFYTKLDLGIVKYHFEKISGHKVISKG